jgi:hypothetical protein
MSYIGDLNIKLNFLQNPLQSGGKEFESNQAVGHRFAVNLFETWSFHIGKNSRCLLVYETV